MKSKLTTDQFLEYLLVMLITTAIAVIGNWISGKFAAPFIEAIPGALILLSVATAGIVLGKLVPRIPGIIWITLIGIALAVEGSPTAPYVVEAVGKIGLLPLATPVLAYAGVNMGKDWAEFKKVGWRGIVITCCVMVGTFVGSALIAHIILKMQGTI